MDTEKKGACCTVRALFFRLFKFNYEFQVLLISFKLQATARPLSCPAEHIVNGLESFLSE